jgi:hypothetical protein
MAYAARNGNHRLGQVPYAHDSALVEKSFSKQSFYKPDTNRVSNGDIHTTNEIINNIEDNVEKRLREIKYTGYYNWKTLPWFWKPPSHNHTAQDDATCGVPDSVETFIEMQQDYRYMLTEIRDLVGLKKNVSTSEDQIKFEITYGVVNGKTCNIICMAESVHKNKPDLQNAGCRFVEFFGGGRFPDEDRTISNFFKPENVAEIRKVLQHTIKVLLRNLPDTVKTQFNKGKLRNWEKCKQLLLSITQCRAKEPPVMKIFAFIKSIPDLTKFGIRDSSIIQTLRELSSMFFQVYKDPINLGEIEGEEYGFIGLELFSPVLNFNFNSQNSAIKIKPLIFNLKPDKS